jgi:hypothetical protein
MDSCSGAAGSTTSATATAQVGGAAVAASAQSSMFYGWCAQANAKGRGKYEEYSQKESLECHEVDECTKILADAQVI